MVRRVLCPIYMALYILITPLTRHHPSKAVPPHLPQTKAVENLMVMHAGVTKKWSNDAIILSTFCPTGLKPATTFCRSNQIISGSVCIQRGPLATGLSCMIAIIEQATCTASIRANDSGKSHLYLQYIDYIVGIPSHLFQLLHVHNNIYQNYKFIT